MSVAFVTNYTLFYSSVCCNQIQINMCYSFPLRSGTMTKSQALVPQFDSHKKKKLKLNVEEITCVQDKRKEEMNGKKKKKKRKADDEVCGYNRTL